MGGSLLEPAAPVLETMHMGLLLLGLELWHLLGQLLLWQLLLLAQSWEAWLARDAKGERPTGCLASYGCNTINDGFCLQSGNAKWQTQAALQPKS